MYEMSIMDIKYTPGRLLGAHLRDRPVSCSMDSRYAYPLILQQADIKRLLPKVDVLNAMRRLFQTLGQGQAVQPPQQVTEFPNGRGDFINYLGVLSNEQVYGIKTSPYIVTDGKPIVTAWTTLMSMSTGQPIALIDAGVLTTHRTAATTALAIDYLAPQEARRLAVVGSGPVGLAHIRYAKNLRDWETISVYSPSVSTMDEQERNEILQIDPRIVLCELQSKALANADVVMLCTSASKAILTTEMLGKPTLVTSISTNAFRAHEMNPADLSKMDVYCDYRKTTPESAGEMVIATQAKQWSREAVMGDLAELAVEAARLPEYRRHVFFRSIGLGLEDVAIALDFVKAANAREI